MFYTKPVGKYVLNVCRTLSCALLGADLDKMWPIIPHGQSDTACLDNALELLLLGGYDLAHAMMMLMPEAWAKNPLMDPARRAFYEYHAALMEPWDGPAAIAFTDGRQIGATLDRNGLRPARWTLGHDGLSYTPDAGYCNDGTPTDDFTYTLAPGGATLATESFGALCLWDVATGRRLKP